MEILLMVIFTALNFLPMRIYGPFYTIVTWWKVIIPVVTIIILFTKFNGGNFSPRRGLFPPRGGWKDPFRALPGAGSPVAPPRFPPAGPPAGRMHKPPPEQPL